MLMNKRIIHKLAEYEKHLIHPSAGDGGGGVCVCVGGGRASNTGLSPN